jgi:D-alanyl-lipoteichoic acid acyltransferase DltB (MBOAT superfamily)
MCWNAKYVVLIFFTTVVTYLGAIVIAKCPKTLYKKLTLAVCTLLCLGVLFVFKYFNFFVQIVGNIVEIPTLDLILPVGISFYTFQTLSYVVDVYRSDVEVENNFGIYAAYISFFPQLVAGPIERARNLLPQIKGRKFFDYGQASYGLKLIAWGLFKKMLIADMLAPYVDKVFLDVNSYSGLSLAVASVFFAFQVYVISQGILIWQLELPSCLE